MTFMKEYDQYDALGLAQLVKNKEVSPAELCEEAIKRIEVINPHINAVIFKMYNEGRRRITEAKDQGAFTGVPFLLKDLAAAYAGVPLTSGCGALRSYVPDYDSEVIKRYKAAGLIMLGKTNTPEFALKAVTEPTAYGITRNPWNLEHTPGGSSGGSAAAVAGGIVPVATAGDGGGSIRIPASHTGLFGLKPSRGRVPTGPNHGELWQGAAVQHVLSRSVRDSAAMLDISQGAMPGEPYVIAPPQRPYLEEVGANPGKLRIGFSVAHPMGGTTHPECIKAVQHTARLLESLGHVVEEVAMPFDGELVAKAYLTMYFGEVMADINAMEKALGRKARPADVEPETWLLGLMGKSLSAGEFATQKRNWNIVARSLGQFLTEYDLLLTPAAAGPPVKIGALDTSPLEKKLVSLVNTLNAGDLLRRSGIVFKLAHKSLERTPYTQAANLAGLPGMSVPLHWTPEGLPIGSMFTAPFGREDVLIRLASQLEEEQPWFHKRPPLLNKLQAELSTHP
jgi:amidase